MRTLRSAQLAGDTKSLKSHREERIFLFKPNLCQFLYKNKQLLLIQLVFILILDPPYYVRLEFQMLEKCDLSFLAFTISDFNVDYQI